MAHSHVNLTLEEAISKQYADGGFVTYNDADRYFSFYTEQPAHGETIVPMELDAALATAVTHQAYIQDLVDQGMQTPEAQRALATAAISAELTPLLLARAVVAANPLSLDPAIVALRQKVTSLDDRFGSILDDLLGGIIGGILGKKE